MTDLFLRALAVHIIGDWFVQSDWMAENKVNLRHLAAWLHSGLHTLGFLFVFEPAIAIFLGISHLIIDTRVPLEWLRKRLGQYPQGPRGSVFEFLQDQAAHILLIISAILVSS